MIYTSLAVLVMSATVIMPPSRLMHFHPHSTQPDTRVTLTLVNHGPLFQDVKIDGHQYTVQAHQGIHVKAPVGTVIFADSATGEFKRGAVIASITPQMKDQSIDLN